MKSANTLKLREAVELRTSEEEGLKVFKVRVHEITSRGIFLDRPIIDRRHLDISPGDVVEVRFWREDAMYSFSIGILELTVHQGMPVIMVGHPKTLNRIQRREHFRVDVLLSLEFITLEEEEEEREETETIYSKGMIQNLSAGGLVFKAKASDTLNTWTGSTLIVSIKLNEDMLFPGLRVRVIRISADEDDSANSRVIGRFVDLPESVREAIIVHNLRHQQKWRSEWKNKEYI